MPFERLNHRQVYADLKRRLDVRQVLEAYGAQNVTEVVSADGTTELVHSCLLERVEPHHANGDAHPSAWANCEKRLYCCAVYWAGDIFHLIQKLEGKTDLSGIMPVVSDFFTGATRSTVAFRQEIEAMLVEPVYSIDLPSYSERVLDPWLKTHPYMLSRGISHKTCELLRIGYDERDNRIVFPVWWDNRLVGWQKRAIPPAVGWPGTASQFPKYKSSSGFPKSETLYNYQAARDFLDVIVVESPMSVAKAEELGLSAMRYSGTVATFGAKVSKHQIDLLKDFEKVTVWFDADRAGSMGARKIVENLYRYTEVKVVSPDKGKDLGDLDRPDQVLEKVEAAQPAALWLAEQDRIPPL